ncbi:MAG: hypothetical protein ACLVJH_08765 [Faecalibacterium prausnitzii]
MTAEHKFVVKLVCYLSDEPEVLTGASTFTPPRKEAQKNNEIWLIRHESEIR